MFVPDAVRNDTRGVMSYFAHLKMKAIVFKCTFARFFTESRAALSLRCWCSLCILRVAISGSAGADAAARAIVARQPCRARAASGWVKERRMLKSHQTILCVEIYTIHNVALHSHEYLVNKPVLLSSPMVGVGFADFNLPSALGKHRMDES